MKKWRKNMLIGIFIGAFVNTVVIALIVMCVVIKVNKPKNELSQKISIMLQDVYSTYGEDMGVEFVDFVSQEDYKYLNYRERDDEIVDEQNITVDLVVKIDGEYAVAYHSYIYDAYDKDGNLIEGSGSKEEPCVQMISLHNDGDKWYVINVYEEE